MFSLLLALIYVAFISLGLPDSLLGSAWPTISEQLNLPVSYAGIISMIIAGGTIISSLMSDRLTRRMGAGAVTAVSVLMTAAALFGFSVSGSFAALCLWSIPYGLGAGAVDAALNNYVALHYSSRHMSWLHCFWGVGVAASPYIMSGCLTRGLGWHSGYRYVSYIQIVLSLILFLSLPLWKSAAHEKSRSDEASSKQIRFIDIFKIRGIKYVILAFFGYCALETTAGLWASSYLVIAKSTSPETAAKYASLFYLGITLGRFLCGFAADRLGDRRLIRIGLCVIFIGIAAVGAPYMPNIVSLSGLVVIGLGCAPIYPSIIHATPFNFGRENSQAVVGIQMASAYTGSTFMPPLFGLIAEHITITAYPLFLLFFAVLMAVMTELLNRAVKKR